MAGYLALVGRSKIDDLARGLRRALFMYAECQWLLSTPALTVRSWPLCTGPSYEQLGLVVRRGFLVMGLDSATGFCT